MISVVIPALNEAKRIAGVVAFARQSPFVHEVLVVDDGSIDGTPELARAAGATVITSTLLGKGASMADGAAAARHEVLLYLDGDLQDLHPDLVARMTEPIVRGEADFVKARFSRSGGRVTALTARPLLRTFFPELAGFEQPLAGIIAARRSLLRQLRLETDYGVDIGLLLDAFAAGARIAEVDIGHVDHDSQPLGALSDMALQVVRTILDRAARYGRLDAAQIRQAEEVERQTRFELSLDAANLGRASGLALFDMDGTLFDGRFVERLAQQTNRSEGLDRYLDNPDMEALERTRRIAALFAGVPQPLFEETARALPLSPGACETVVGLRKLGYRVGIVTDSYFIASEIVRRRVFADFSVGHGLHFQSGLATGQVTLSAAMTHPAGCSRHAHCKRNAMHHVLEKMELGPDRVLAVGDGENDVCLLRVAGTSVAYRPKTLAVRAAAAYVIHDDLTEILNLVDLPAAFSFALGAPPCRPAPVAS